MGGSTPQSSGASVSVQPGSTARTLESALQRAQAGGIAAWMLVQIAAVLISPELVLPVGLLVVAHLVVAVASVAIAARAWPAWPLLVGASVVCLLDHAATPAGSGPLGFVAVWSTILFAGMPVFLLPTLRALVVGGVVLAVNVGAMLWWSSELAADVVVAMGMAATGVLLTLATLMVVTPIRKLAALTDARQAAVDHERDRVVVADRVRRAVAVENAAMHDSLINTLGAIANGGAALTDLALVRVECAQDAADVEAVLRGRREDTRFIRDLSDAVPSTIAFHRTGLADAELELIGEALPPGGAAELRRAVREAIRNAVRHANPQAITLDVQQEGGVVTVAITDDGLGLDVSSGVGARLAASLSARAEGLGAEVQLDARPGAGTRVAFSLDLNASERVELRDDIAGDEVSAAPDYAVVLLLRTAGWKWATAMIAFGAANVIAAGPASWAPVAITLAVVVALSVLAGLVARRDRAAPVWLAGLLLAGVPVTVLFGVGAVPLGSGNPFAWPLITLAVLPVLLLTLRSRRALFVANLLLVCSAIVVVAVLWQGSPTTGLTAIFGTMIPLVMLGVWSTFASFLDELAPRLRAVDTTLTELRNERAAREEVHATQERWAAGGLTAALGLLRGISSGVLDPRSLEVRVESGAAEFSLRQVVLVDQESVHLAPWLHRALGHARDRFVQLDLSGCRADADDAAAAQQLGQLILAGVDALHAQAALNVGTYRVDGALQMFLIGPAGALLGVAAEPAGSIAVRYQQLAGHDLVEVRLSRSDVLGAQASGAVAAIHHSPR